MTVTRADLEEKLREIQSVVEETKEGARSASVLLAVAAVALILLFYSMGRRRGRRSAARIEVYRVR